MLAAPRPGPPTPPGRPVRTNYVFIDFENVQPESLGPLDHDHVRVLVFVGANQARLPFEFAASLQRLGDRAAYVKVAGTGPNALDFHIAYALGQFAAVDPSGYFHIISKDTGFDPLIRHLRATRVLARRSPSLSELPPALASKGMSPEERLRAVVARLRQMAGCEPATVKALRNTVAAVFQKQLEEHEVTALVDLLAGRGFLSVAGDRITYTLPGDGRIL